MKKCPKCDIDLKTNNSGPIEVEECEQCKGIWFDKNELRQCKDVEETDLNWLDFEIWKHQEQFKSKNSAFKCPTCDKSMVRLNYGDTSVEIDYCPSCQGTWLEEGEFIKIIDSLEKELNTMSFPQFVKESVQEAKEIITGPESLLSEWKDFSTVLRLMQYRLFVENPKLLDAIIKAQKMSPFK